MNTQIKSRTAKANDVESGVMDSGLSEKTVVKKTVRPELGKPNAEEIDDLKADINCYGVGVIKMDE